jgi:hypothetical protein
MASNQRTNATTLTNEIRQRGKLATPPVKQKLATPPATSPIQGWKAISSTTTTTTSSSSSILLPLLHKRPFPGPLSSSSGQHNLFSLFRPYFINPGCIPPVPAALLFF